MANIDLHIHPMLENYKIPDIVSAMNKTGLDIIALEALDKSIFYQVAFSTEINYPYSQEDSAGIRMPDGKIFLNAREYNTKEGLHIHTIGYSMDDATPKTEIRKIIDNALAHDAFVLLDHPFVDNGKTRTAGHIDSKLENTLTNICKEYSGEISLEWNAYCIPWMRQTLKHVLNVFGTDIKYHDVNKKAEELSINLAEEGYNVPIVADTDLHARRKSHLNYMGTSRIITKIEGETPRQVVSSMKKNIFDGNYENVKRNVSAMHLIDAFGLPVLFPKYYNKPRG
jgi:hypothetical protein